MSFASMQCSTVPLNRTMAPRAPAQRNRLLCRAAVQPTEGATRRQSLGLLLALPVLFTGNTANALEFGDARKVKGAGACCANINWTALNACCTSYDCGAYCANASRHSALASRKRTRWMYGYSDHVRQVERPAPPLSESAC